MTSSDLSILVSYILTNSPKDISVQDTTGYAALGVNENAVLGVVKIVSPEGDVIYNNTNFASPDIDLDNTSIGDTLTGVSAPLDTTGAVLTGDYTVTYTMREYSTSVSKAIVAVTTATKTFEVSGDWTTQILATDCFYVDGSTGNDNGYTVASVTYDAVSGNTEIVVNETVASAVADGSFYWYDNSTEYSTEETSNFCFTDADPDLQVSHNCTTSTIELKDESTYIAYYNSTPLNYDTISRTLTLKYPTSMVTVPSDLTTTSNYISTSPIYTKTWVALVETTLTYTLPDGSSVTTLVTSSLDHEVVCDDCQCVVYQCLANLSDSYVAALSVNNSEAERLKAKVIKANMYYMLYSMAVRCGEDGSEWCEALTELANSEGCGCDTVDETVSTLVVASASGSSTGSVVYYNVWRDGAGLPSSSLGNDGDYYLTTSAGGGALEGDVYKKISGSWSLIMNVKGTTGAAGSDGTSILYTSYASKYITGVGPTSLSEYVLPADTLSAEGDMIVVEGTCLLDGQTGVKYNQSIKLGSTTIASSTVEGQSQYLKIKAYITRGASKTAQYIEWESMYSENPASVQGPRITTATESLGTDLTIALVGSKTGAGIATDMGNYNLRVTLYKI